MADYKESAVECEEVSVKNSDSDSRFARPKDFKLNMTFKQRMDRIWKMNAVSMDKLSK